MNYKQITAQITITYLQGFSEFLRCTETSKTNLENNN